MVHVGQKAATLRTARASALVHLGETARDLVRDNQIRKGDVLTTAQLAGIMGAKHTSLLIPLCHNITISQADVQLRLHADLPAVHVAAEVAAFGPTGVEMEALTAASVAALTVYDMCKSVTKSIVISDLQLDYKCGGKSGTWHRTPASAV